MDEPILAKRRGDWLSARSGDQLVMMCVETGNYVGLNPVGTRIWELIETPRKISELCSILMQEYDVPADTCETDVQAFLNDMMEQGLLVLTPAPVE